jgi:apolipoprotein D and lipocalin family protein
VQNSSLHTSLRIQCGGYQKRPTPISRIWGKNFIDISLTLSNLKSDYDIVADRADTMTELETVKHVDVTRYMGTWFEIAKFPLRYEKGLVGITATYTLLPNGKVRVLNSGYEGGFDGKLKTARGKAWVVDTVTNAKLKVSFFWPFAANYWILELGKDYEYAVVGEESRNYLWILSRTPQMDETVYNELLKRVQSKGYDLSKLERSPQKPTAVITKL